MAAQELAKALERLECDAVRGWKDSGEELLLSFRQAALEGGVACVTMDCRQVGLTGGSPNLRECVKHDEAKLVIAVFDLF